MKKKSANTTSEELWLLQSNSFFTNSFLSITDTKIFYPLTPHLSHKWRQNKKVRKLHLLKIVSSYASIYFNCNFQSWKDYYLTFWFRWEIHSSVPWCKLVAMLQYGPVNRAGLLSSHSIPDSLTALPYIRPTRYPPKMDGYWGSLVIRQMEYVMSR